ncbi:hypothetical protein [Vibrio europaeus]|uniref:hypothetical protein n=1 Tax=Vibrio europaeus TaxID=300876 RepID=UPI00233EB485|nr:hypothetical protein [Vibrio europaeus]MDC5753523.1 hypothetical protein [Vibrio europaeus]MDC5816564.1 hypothetical protein [Vibrio europaeus]
MNQVEKIEHYITVADTSQLPLLTDIQFGERFTSASLNRHWKNIKAVGIYAGFVPKIVGVDTVEVGDSSGKNTLVAGTESGEFHLTVHQQKPVTLTIPRDQQMTAVVEAFFQFGVLTKQVNANSDIDAATLKLIPTADVKSHHVQIFSVLFPSSAPALANEHINTDVRVDGNIAGTLSREEIERGYVNKTADGGAMVVPFSSHDNNPVDGLERWNPVKKRVEYSKGGKWNGMGGGGSTLKDVEIDTLLASGEGCIVDTIKAQKQIVITLSGNGNATGGDEHIVGDIKSGSAFKYPIKVVAEGDTKVDGEPEFLIDIDGARVTFNYNEEKDSWELSSGFGERPTPKAVFHPFEAKAKKGDTTFNFPYSIGFVTYSLNGVEQSKDDFTATDGKTIVLTKPIKRDGDVVQFKAWLLVDQISDVTYTRKDQDGKALRGATSISLPAGFLQNDVAKSYYFEIGGVRQWPDKHYTVSSATNEILLKEPLDNDYDWYLLSEAQVQLFVGQDSQIDADNTNNSLTGKSVKENIDQLDEKVEAIPDVLGNQNLFINGCFSEWQRGASFTQIYNAYTADRWIVRGGIGGTTQAIRGVTPLGQKYLFIRNSGNTNYLALWQRIETINPASLVKKTMTLSSDVNFDHDVDVSISAGWAKVKDGSNASSELVTPAKAVVGGSDQKIVATFDVPEISDMSEPVYLSVGIYVNPSSHAPDGEYRFYNAKLERGDKATPFIPDLPSVNLAKCQRYYEVGATYGHAGAVSQGLSQKLSVSKRVSSKHCSITVAVSTHFTGAAAGTVLYNHQDVDHHDSFSLVNRSHPYIGAIWSVDAEL